MSRAELYINRGNKIYSPIVLEDITWETERVGVPGKLTFSILKDDGNIVFEEGDAVRLIVDKKNVFFGFLFTQKRSQDETISWTAYDQIRYLQFKDSIVYKNKTASEVVKLVAGMAGCKTGKIDDTKFKIIKKLEENVSYLDIILNALDETLMSKNRLYTLYDDFGKLRLGEMESMKLDLMINEDLLEGFSYTSSIDSNTYNKIKLAYVDDKQTLRYITEDSIENIKKWGILQYSEKLENSIGAKEKAEQLLKYYNRKTKNLSISGIVGDSRVRAGASIMVRLDLGDSKLNQYMLVEKAKHVWKENEYKMELTLRGGNWFV